MAKASIQQLGSGLPNMNSVEAIKQVVAKLLKELDHLMRNIDSSNVTKINTSRTEVQDENGLTKLLGALIEMYDNADTLRIQMGYDEDSSSFVFSLKDESGTETIGLDSSGEAVVKKLSAGSPASIQIEDFGATHGGSIRFIYNTATKGYIFTDETLMKIQPEVDFYISTANNSDIVLVPAGGETYKDGIAVGNEINKKSENDNLYLWKSAGVGTGGSFTTTDGKRVFYNADGQIVYVS